MHKNKPCAGNWGVKKETALPDGRAVNAVKVGN
jgi:hypothetical protein